MPYAPGTALTLADMAKEFPNGAGSSVHLINILSKKNALFDDMLFVPTNKDDAYLFNALYGLPNVTYRSLYEGVVASRSSRKQVQESCTLFEEVAEIDKELINIAPDKGLYRAQEASAALESVANRVSRELWYGSKAADYRAVMGLSERYSKLSNPDISELIIDAGGTGNVNSSIWLVGWGERTFHAIYPKNTRAGLEHTMGDKPIDLIDPVNNGTYEGYRDRVKYRFGIALEDYRFVARICNIDVPKLATFETGSDVSAKLLTLINQLTHRVHNLTGARFAFYMNRDVAEAYEQQLMAKQNLALTIDAATGKIVPSYKGIPIKVDDNILSTEERVQ
jgi:hypothetical protein